MSLPVSSTVARISWLKESGCCLWLSYSYLSVVCFCLSLHLLDVSQPVTPGRRSRSAVWGQYHICLLSVSDCLFICWMALYLYLLAESVFCLCSVSYLSFSCLCLSLHLLHGFFLGLLTCISWLKESVCCLCSVSYLCFFCLFICCTDFLAEGVGLLSLVSIISACLSYVSCLPLHLSDVSLPVSPSWRSLSVSYLSVVCFCLSLYLLDVSLPASPGWRGLSVSYLSVVCFCLSLHLLHRFLPGSLHLLHDSLPGSPGWESICCMCLASYLSVACLYICWMTLYLDLLAEGVGLLSVVSVISVCRLSLHLLHVSLPVSPGWRSRSALWLVSYLSVVCFLAVSSYVTWLSTWISWPKESVFPLLSIISVCRLFLLVSLSVGWLSTCISWPKESVCCLWLVSYLSDVCFCLSLHLLDGPSTCISWLKESVCCPILRLNSWILLSRLVAISNPACVGAC